MSELKIANWHEDSSSVMLTAEAFGGERRMNRPHCASSETRERAKKTVKGYRIYQCQQCRRTFNECSSTPFNCLEYPTDIVLLVMLWRLRYKLSLRDLTEMFLELGFQFAHDVTTTSISGSSKIIVGSSCATTPCVALETLRLHHNFVEPLMRFAGSFDFAR